MRLIFLRQLQECFFFYLKKGLLFHPCAASCSSLHRPKNSLLEDAGLAGLPQRSWWIPEVGFA